MAETFVATRVLERSLRRQRVFIDRLNPLEILRSEDNVRSRYRFHTVTIYSILRLIFEDIVRPTRRSMALPLLVILCSALRFYATGSFYMVLGNCLLICPASMCRCVQTVTEALIKRSNEFIKWPCSTDALESLKERFYNIAGKNLSMLYKHI